MEYFNTEKFIVEFVKQLKVEFETEHSGNSELVVTIKLEIEKIEKALEDIITIINKANDEIDKIFDQIKKTK
jgi:hypothetical protein